MFDRDYGVNFIILCSSRKKRTYQPLDFARRRRWIRPRIPISPKVSKELKATNNESKTNNNVWYLFWDVSISEYGSKTISINTRVKLSNQLPYDLLISLYGLPYQNTSEMTFVVSRYQETCIPISYCQATSLRFRPKDVPLEYCEPPIECRLELNDFETLQDVQCQGGKEYESTYARVYVIQNDKNIEIHILPHITLRNLLPCDLKYRCGGGSSIANETGTLSPGTTTHLVHLDRSNLNSAIAFLAGSFQWTDLYTFDIFTSEPRRILLSDSNNNKNKQSDNEMTDDPLHNSFLTINIICSENKHGTKELIIYSDAALVDRTGLDICVQSRYMKDADAIIRYTSGKNKSSKNNNSTVVTVAEEDVQLLNMKFKSSRAYEIVSQSLIGAKVHTDRDWRWTYLPESFLRGVLLSTPFDDRAMRAEELINFQVSCESIIIILFDIRIIHTPSWLRANGYRAVVEQAVAQRHSTDNRMMSCHYVSYAKLVNPNDTVVLGSNASRDTRGMYVVFVVPARTPEAEQLLAQVNYDLLTRSNEAKSSWANGGAGVALFSCPDEKMFIGIAGWGSVQTSGLAKEGVRFSRPAPRGLYQQATGGCLSYIECVELAKSCHARLPTVAEVREEIKKNNNRPLYDDRDMWWPVSDAPNTWVSVGVYESQKRLGYTHNDMFGPPGWGEQSQHVAERELIAIVPLSADFKLARYKLGWGKDSGCPFPPPADVMNINTAEVSLTMFHQHTDGCLSYSECAELAKSCHARLPTVAEVREEIKKNNNRPLYDDRDMWWPVSDAPNTWISVGVHEWQKRLGRTHNELFGPPGWGEKSFHVAEREMMVIIPLSSEIQLSSHQHKGCLWSPELPVVSIGNSKGKFEIVTNNSSTNISYQLAYRVSQMPGAFYRTKVITIMPHYCIVNRMEMPLEICQEGLISHEHKIVVEPWNSSAWHKADANRGTAVHLRCQGSSWSLGTVDINNIGTSLLLLPSEKTNNVLCNKTDNLIAPTVLHVEVKEASVTENCCILIVIWKATVEDDALLSIKNDSSHPVTIRQNLPFETLNLSVSDCEIIVPSGAYIPYGWTVPYLESKATVVIGTSLQNPIGIPQEIDLSKQTDNSLIVLEKFQEASRNEIDKTNNKSINYNNTKIFLKLQNFGRSRVIHISDNELALISKNKSSVAPKRDTITYINIKYICVSIIAERPVRRELLDIVIKEVKCHHVSSSTDRTLDFSLHDLQVKILQFQF